MDRRSQLILVVLASATLASAAISVATPLAMEGHASGHDEHASASTALATAKRAHYASHHPLLGELGDRYGHLYATDPAPPGLDPAGAAHYWTSERVLHDRTATAWVGLGTEELARSVRPAAADPQDPAPSASPQRLAAAVLELYEVVGAPVTPDVEHAVLGAAHDLAPPLRGPLTELVTVTTQAYAEQRLIAYDVEERWDPTNPYAGPLVTAEERDAMEARTLTLTDALARFQAHAAPTLRTLDVPAAAAADPPLFEDPEGLVILGGPGDGLYTRAGAFPDPVLLVEPGGNDRYEVWAGAADPTGLFTSNPNELALAVHLDLDGDDVYVYEGPPATVQGAGGPGAIGILVDVAGNDDYVAKMTRSNTGPFPVTYFDGGGQGYGYAGYGVLVDGLGNDRYRFDATSTDPDRSIWAFAQGFGAAGGVGIASDLAGDDRWVGYGQDIPPRPYGGPGLGFIGVYVQGIGFFGGIGIAADTGLGNDLWVGMGNGTTTDYYSQAFGAFGGVGILYEDGGDDAYIAIEDATNPHINPLLNCAFGTGSFGGVGIFVELAGNDHYYGETISPWAARTMNEGYGGPGPGYGVHLDLGGDDVREMYATGGPGSVTVGRGEHEVLPDPVAWIANTAFLGASNHFGTYLDAGGTDTYVGPPYTFVGSGDDPNDAVWPGGADLGGGSP